MERSGIPVRFILWLGAYHRFLAGKSLKKASEYPIACRFVPL